MTGLQEHCKIYCSMEEENEKYILCEFTEKYAEKSGQAGQKQRKRDAQDGQRRRFARIDRRRFRW